MTRKILLSLWILVMACLVAIAGYRDGKRDADRWWQAHTPVKLEKLMCFRMEGIVAYAIDCPKRFVLGDISDEMEPCGFEKPCHDEGMVCEDGICRGTNYTFSNSYVDADNTICYDPTTGKRCDLPKESKQDAVKP